MMNFNHEIHNASVGAITALSRWDKGTLLMSAGQGSSWHYWVRLPSSGYMCNEYDIEIQPQEI